MDVPCRDRQAAAGMESIGTDCEEDRQEDAGFSRVSVTILAPCFQYLPILAASLLCQKDEEWRAIVCHDGPWDEWDWWKQAFEDPRIQWRKTAERLGEFGHPIRDIMLAEEDIDTRYVVLSNGDNYFMPTAVASINGCTSDVVAWGACHDYYNYATVMPRVEIGHIDLSSIAVRTEIAQEIGFPWRDEASDFLWIQELAKATHDWKFLDKPLFVHN
jgi:hypothetical protein